ncbi:MAG: class I SAM-dependent methyltransferase [Candidatus Helarchaeota archaeon]
MNGWNPEFYDEKANVQYNLGLKTMQLLQIRDGESILDIGCGTGLLTIEIAKKTPNGLVIGLDNHPDMIKKAVHHLKRSGITNLQFLQGDILQFTSTIKFNAIFSNSALHWVKKTRDLYQKIYNLLLQGGRLMAQMATKGSLDSFAAVFIEPIQPLNLTRYFTSWNYPAKLLTPKYLQKILHTIGFQEIEIWVEPQKLEFNSAEELIDFLKTAALVPILSQLPPEKQGLYLDYLLKIFKTQKQINLLVQMKRLFLKLKK